MDKIDFSGMNKTKFDVSTRFLMPVVIYLEKKYSKEIASDFIKETGLDKKYLLNERNWISFDYYNRFLEKLVDFTANPRAPFEAGFYVLSKEAYGSFYSLLIVLKLFGSPKIAYKKIVEMSKTISNVADFKIISAKRFKVVAEHTMKEGYTQTKLNCETIQGIFVTIPLFWHLPPARVKHVQCAAEGHHSCLYEVSWLPRSFKNSILSSIAFLLLTVELVLFFFHKLPALELKDLIISGVICLSISLGERIFHYKKLMQENKILEDERSQALAEALESSKKEYKQLKDANIRIFEVVNKLTIVNYIAEEIFKIDEEDELIQRVLNTIAGCLNFDRGYCIFLDEDFRLTKPVVLLDIMQNRNIRILKDFSLDKNQNLITRIFKKQLPHKVDLALIDENVINSIVMPLNLRLNNYLFVFDNYKSTKQVKESRLFFFSTITSQIRLALEKIYTARAAHNIISNIPSAILIFDRVSFEISYVNKAYQEFAAGGKDEVLGQSILDVLGITGLNRKIFLERICEVSEQIHIDSQELQTGSKVLGYTLFNMPADSRGKAEVGMVMKEITKQKELQDQLLRSEKLAALGTLASGVAHEINNPLYGVLGTAEVIVDEAQSEDVKKMAEDIIDFTMQVSDIVKDLSSYSRSIREEKPKHLDVNTILDEALRILKYSPAFIDVQVEKSYGELPELFALGGEISQIFMNLLNNAIQAMGGRGRLKIVSGLIKKRITVSIEDDGPGIPAELITKIFDPFFTTKPAGEGTGLGLNIVYRLVTKYNGFITAKNSDDRGALFVVEFPVQE